MTNETRNRIQAYVQELPFMKEKIYGALLMLVIAAGVIVASSYAWVTLSRSPEVSEITTTLAANGALEIALSKPNGTMPDEFDIDESITQDTNVTVSNLQWGNLVNLSDASYGIDNLALRPAQLNTANLIYSPLWGAVYGEDGRITKLNSSYTYTKFDGTEFIASKEYGVRAISSYTTTTSSSTARELQEKTDAVTNAQAPVFTQYSTVIGKFATLGQLITRVAQDKVNGSDFAVDSTQTDSDLASYLPAVRDFYVEMKHAMVLQQDAYVALANLQLYQWSKSNDQEFVAISWSDLEKNHASYNTSDASVASKNGIIALTGLTQYVKDYMALCTDLTYLEKYVAAREADSSVKYYWSHGGDAGYQIVNMINRLIDYSSMYLIIDGEKVLVGNLQSKAMELLANNNGDYPVYVQKGILQRFEQSALDETARMNGNAQCNISVKAKKGITITLNVKGHAYSTATGSSYFAMDFAATQNRSMDASDKVAEDTYGLAIDLWVRTNAEETCLTLEGATSTDVQGNIVSYDGINRIWGATGEAVLTTDSTTQGGGSCYIYYADTPEDMARSLDLLKAMKVAFVDSSGKLLATAEMDTVNYWAVNGRITVPLVLDDQNPTTYVYTDSTNKEQVGYAVTTLYTDIPVRVTAIVYLDGTRLTNDDVLAAAEIQGSLNIQFGSSVDLETIGSNELIDDVRTVTATVSPEKLDYDSAKVDADMTTRVTVNVEGQSVDPTKVTAFFVRAINSTQGSREKTMTFAKQPNGTWVCDYRFTAPGTYYLRQVRLDGVDYTLADPQKVEISGFGLSSVTWSELSDSVTIRTSDGSHSTTVTVQFASNDRSKLPTSVQARFVREDGNTVNVPLTYNASGHWRGTGSFSASGVYQLQYLVADGRYIDLALNDGSYRTMDLSLGMYVTVTDLSGGLVQEYEEGKLYPKKVAVRVYNNAGAELEALEGLRLIYSNGGSATNTFDADLAWDEVDRCYTGTLPIENPGRYRFLAVTAENNYLTKCDESPVYTVISPDPPIYDAENSACTKDVEYGIQFVPLTDDEAVIDGIVIENAASASASAVVYSAVSDSYYTVDMLYANNSWYVKLPTYNGEQIGEDSNGNLIYEQVQDGQWSLAAIRLWDCYDGSSNFREETNPILWVDNGTVGQNYLDTLTDDVTPDATLDFSALTTNVSGRVNVVMDPGTTTLGSMATPFGTVFPVSTGTGMSVTLTDGAGRPLPKEKITDVTLNVSYGGNTNTAYGYKVSNYVLEYEVKLGGTLETYDKENGICTVSSNDSWTYVGKYTVKSLVVTIGEKTLTYSPGSNDVPAAYYVTTMAPTAANVKLDSTSVTQGQTEFGGSANNVTGTFLKAYDLDDTSVDIKLIGASGQSMDNAVLEGLSANLVLTHKRETSQDKGGYTFSGTPYEGYPNLILPMTEQVSGSGLYQAPEGQTLLAGVYEARIEVTVGSTTEPMPLKDVTVWSIRPDVKITGVTEGAVMVNKNDDPTTNHLVANAESFGPVENQHGDYYAVVYMQYAVGAAWSHSSGTACGSSTFAPAHVNDYANYTKPQITFALTDVGTNAASAMSLPGNEETVNWASGSTAATVGIGKIATETVNDGSHQYGGYSTSTCYYRCITEKATLLGSVSVNTITTTVGSATYTRTLANPLAISQLSRENPTLTWNAGSGTTIKVKAGTTIYTDTTDIPAMTSLTATVTANNGYHHPQMTQPEGVYNWTKVSEGETEAVYTFQIAGNATLSGSATKYPAITFSSGNNATVAVTVDGTSITSNTGAKTDSAVVVTVTADRANGYCKPRLAQPSGVTNWTANEGDFVSTYTFTMPNKAVSLAKPTTSAMYKLSWTGDKALDEFYVFDKNLPSEEGVIKNGDYVVPGHNLTITLTAIGGVDPVLTAPTDATLESSSTFAATYSYIMPSSALHLTATADGYPAVILDNDYASFKVYRNVETDPLNYTVGDGVSIKPGYTVKVVLTAKDGWYAPRMNVPSEATNWKVVGTPDNVTATYTFSMPNAEVDATSCISATAAPSVNITASNASVTMSYTDYAGTVHNNVPFGTKVQPGATVTVALDANNGYYAPRMSGVTVVSEGDWAAGYTFTMGTSNANLSASATAMPTLTLSASSATLSVQYTGYKNASLTATSGSVKVKPNTTVSVTATAASTHYLTDAMVTVGGNALTGTGDYGTRSYTFTVGTASVTLAVSATSNPTIKYVEDSGLSGTVSIDGVKFSNGQTASFRPGRSVLWSATYEGNSDKKTIFKKEADGKEVFSSGDASGYYTMPEYNVTVTAQSTLDACVTPDTLVTLADGTQKEIQYVTYEDQLLVWDFTSGEYVVKPTAILINMGEGNHRVITLEFDNGATVRMIHVHGFFDMSANKFVFINEENVNDYIGHKFAFSCDEGFEAVELIGYSVAVEHTVAYSIFSHEHYNALVEGVLSVTPYPDVDNVAFYDCWPVGDDMMYDVEKMQEYIDKHGLYSYEDWAGYGVTHEQYIAANLAYIKVVVGEGALTFKEALGLIAGFMPKN